MSRNTARVVAALAGGGVLALSVPALAAVSASSPPAGVAVQFLGTGTVVARGAAVKLTLRVTCPAASTTYLSVQVSERVGRGIAGGSNGLQVACSNVPQLITLVLPAAPGGRAFTAGAAAASGELQSYVPGSTSVVDLRPRRVVTLA